MERANCFRHSLKKSVRVKSDGSDSLLGIKRGKAVTNYPKHGEKMNFFERIALFLRANQEQITHIALF